ncbi:UvrD-helicase domain-containing protein [Carnobacterium maltaromaticum]
MDEYQDVNQLQENIIRWLSSEDSVNGNLFMVGKSNNLYLFA